MSLLANGYLVNASYTRIFAISVSVLDGGVETG